MDLALNNLQWLICHKTKQNHFDRFSFLLFWLIFFFSVMPSHSKQRSVLTGVVVSVCLVLVIAFIAVIFWRRRSRRRSSNSGYENKTFGVKFYSFCLFSLILSSVCPGYDTKLSLIMRLQSWSFGMRGTPSLSLPGMVVPVRVLSMGQIELFNDLLRIIIYLFIYKFIHSFETIRLCADC